LAPQTQPSTKRRRGPGTPEIWFKIVHVTLEEVNPAAWRDQTVEVTLGPWNAFENGNVGQLKRRVPASQVVTAVPERQRRPKRPKPPKEPRTPGAVKALLKAREWKRQLDAGEVGSQAEIARREHLTRARVTQILNLLRLTPEIQEHVLQLSKSTTRPPFSEHTLRRVMSHGKAKHQLAAFHQVVAPPKTLRSAAAPQPCVK
jgi:hypothetical protein